MLNLNCFIRIQDNVEIPLVGINILPAANCLYEHFSYQSFICARYSWLLSSLPLFQLRYPLEQPAAVLKHKTCCITSLNPMFAQ